MSERRVLLIIGGGIAAYKAPELVRQLKAKGLAVRCLLTAAAEQFVSPLSLASVSGDKVYENLFDLTDEAEMGHIQLSRDADLILVAPATADLISKMAQGLANDLASTTLLATDKPVMIAPAMNVRMWEHPATQRNLGLLRADGIALIGPDEGDMACGEFGLGRMSDPIEIAAAAHALIEKAPARTSEPTAPPALAGRKILVTAGPTYEPIDPVRYIANRSSGKQGYAVAVALQALGAEVHLVSGPTALNDPQGMRVTRVETAQEMLHACQASLPVDAAIMAAAVADWRPSDSHDKKIKKTKSGLDDLKLTENPDILATIAKQGDHRPALVVGFAAETDKVETYASEKLARKNCDWIVANDVSQDSGIEGGVMGSDENRVHLITQTGTQNWAQMPKVHVAQKLAHEIATHFTPTKETR
jgi:phosphopantothenoylcysteine decarboxylase/phosphopantothenate--cysteine ligase